MNITIEQIKEHVDIRLGVDISKRSRKEEYTFGRSIFYTLCLEFYKTSYSKLGNSIGVKSHGAVMNSKNYTFPYAMTFPMYKKAYADIRNLLNGEVIDYEAKIEVLNQEVDMLRKEVDRLRLEAVNN